jgi:hypothetical protein
MPSSSLTGGRASSTYDEEEAAFDSESDGEFDDFFPPTTHDLYRVNGPAAVRLLLDRACHTDEDSPGIPDPALTGITHDYYLPPWVRGIDGFELLCKSTLRFQELAQLRKSAEIGQAVPMEDANTPERDALFSELALVARPQGWHGQSGKDSKQGEDSVSIPRDRMLPLLEGAEDSVYMPRDRSLPLLEEAQNPVNTTHNRVLPLSEGEGDSVYMPGERILPLLEGATTHLAAVNWEWEHALPRAAFLTFCMARMLDDDRFMEVVEELPPADQGISRRLSSTLVRARLTFPKKPHLSTPCDETANIDVY